MDIEEIFIDRRKEKRGRGERAGKVEAKQREGGADVELTQVL